MILNFIAIIAGFILLIWSADRFIIGAAATARNFDVPPLIIGLTIVGFGTSAPEMMVAGFASYDGSPAMAIGNALGSNITNITLVLGIAALITPLDVHSRITFNLSAYGYNIHTRNTAFTLRKVQRACRIIIFHVKM